MAVAADTTDYFNLFVGQVRRWWYLLLYSLSLSLSLILHLIHLSLSLSLSHTVLYCTHYTHYTYFTPTSSVRRIGRAVPPPQLGKQRARDVLEADQELPKRGPLAREGLCCAYLDYISN